MSENYTVEQNAGENQIEGGVLSISGSVAKHYRPFKNNNELLEAFDEKWEDCFGLGSMQPCCLAKPAIWVRSKSESKCVLQITGYSVDDEGKSVVWLTDSWITLEKLYDDFVFLDDSPIGGKE